MKHGSTTSLVMKDESGWDVCRGDGMIREGSSGSPGKGCDVQSCLWSPGCSAELGVSAFHRLLGFVDRHSGPGRIFFYPF